MHDLATGADRCVYAAAPRVAIIGGDHLFDKPGTPIIFSGRPEMPTTIIEQDCWLGYASVIRAGVRIGRGAIIGANAVITRDVGPYEIWAGFRHENRRALCGGRRPGEA